MKETQLISIVRTCHLLKLSFCTPTSIEHRLGPGRRLGHALFGRLQIGRRLGQLRARLQGVGDQGLQLALVGQARKGRANQRND